MRIQNVLYINYLPADILLNYIWRLTGLGLTVFRLFSCHCGVKNKNEDCFKRQQFNYDSNLSFSPKIQSNRCHFNDRNVLTRFVIPVMLVFAPLP